MTKKLNFFPYYKALLESGEKTTTIRLSNREQFAPGDEVDVTLGWDLDEAQDLRLARIVNAYKKRLCDLSDDDFAGESPDCREPYPTSLVLSSIYRTTVGMDDDVWVVKFEYVDSPQ